MMIHVELCDEQTARLDRLADALHKSRGEASAQLIEEGLRRAEFPAIEFRDTVVGREAYLVGSRVAVWQLLMIAEGYGMDASATAQHLAMDPDRVSQALRYVSAFPSEVRQALDQNRSISADILQKVLPAGALIVWQ